MRPLAKVQFCSSPRQAQIFTQGIPAVFRGLKLKPWARMGPKRAFGGGFIVVLCLIAIIALLGCASQQDVLILDSRLAAMEERSAATEQQNLQFEPRLDENRKNVQDLRERSADQNVLINQLKGEIRILRGNLEETQYLLKQKVKSLEGSKGKRKDQLDRIEQMVSANMDRIIHIEQYLNLEPTESGLKPTKESQAKSDTSDTKELSAEKIYKSAKQAFISNDFERAREEFGQLLKRYPKASQADNAQFWIGETYYREKWYEKAILEYQKVIEKYPKGNKVPASLLKQGFAFASLGDKTNTRLILTELVKKYPKSNEAKIAKQRLKRLKP